VKTKLILFFTLEGWRGRRGRRRRGRRRRRRGGVYKAGGQRAPAPRSPSRRHAVGQRREAEGELRAAAARGLGGSPGLRRPGVLHRPQHPADVVDRPQR